jgi:outer membrane immunogenic protein
MRMLWLAAVAALSMVGVANAGDAKLPAKAPPLPPPAPSWTGCYAGAGGGYGVSNEDTALVTVRALPGIPVGTTFVNGITQGGRGWLATAQLGCDYQFSTSASGNWVVGAFVDGDWADIQGRHTGGNQNIGLQQGEETLHNAFSAGARVGLLVTPALLTYVSGGYTQAWFGDVNYVNAVFPAIGNPNGLQVPARSQPGWFIGGGVEYALPWVPGLFWKTEYRFADYGTSTETVMCTSAPLCGPVGPTAFAEQNRPIVQTVRTELVWRFNWNGLLASR